MGTRTRWSSSGLRQQARRSPLTDALTPSPGDDQVALIDGPELLRWEARVLRMSMRRDWNTADPVPGVAALEGLAATLDLAAAASGADRLRVLGRVATADNLELVAGLIRAAEGATLKGQRADEELRLEAAQTLRAVRQLLQSAAAR
jgi:hypothetical protein